ncbi:MAG: BamA/TamA family outer membrane protein [Flavobacteriales bacterium]
MRVACLLSILLGLSAFSYSQHFLRIKGDSLPEGVGVDESYASAIDRRDALDSFLRTCWSEGYLAASIDSIKKDGDTLTAYYYRGKTYRWGTLTMGSSGRGMILDAGVEIRRLKGERIAPKALAELFEKILEHCEQNGYPFAEVGMDSLRRGEGGVRGRLALDKGPLVRLDTVIMKGEDVVHRSFLRNYLGLKKGMIYDEKRYKRIDQRMRSLSFLDPSQPSELLFTEDGLAVYLYPKEREASRFKGVVGLQPKKGKSGVFFTGDVTLGLKNALNRGEAIELDWNRMKVGTQDLSVSYNHPYLFRTPFGIEGGLKLYRKDSSFTELEQRIALQYLFAGEDHFQVHYERKKWTLLKGGERSRQKDLPFANIRVDAYGIGFKKSSLNRRIMPRKGFRGDVEGSVGRKKLLGKQPAFVERDRKLDSNGQSLQYEMKASLEAFVPLLPRLILMGKLQGAFIKAPYIVQNELFRIGGHGSLRGVGKESIRASAYSIATLELRYLLEAKSDLHLFFDGAYHEDRSGNGSSLDRPFGFGVGSSFKTQAGIFSIDYALGKRFDNPIRLRDGRIHFGFTSLF